MTGRGLGGLMEALRPKSNYRTDGEAWLKDRLGEYAWSKQVEIMKSVDANKFTAVPSGHGMGKSHIGGREVCRFIDARPPGEAFVISTAPSAAQVSSILWRYIGQAHRKGKLPGRILTAGYPQWKLHEGPDGLVGYGRKPSDYSDSAFQGIHAPEGVLIVVDEANGVSRHLFQQIMSVASTEDCRVLLIGNPTDPASYFAEACQPTSIYNVIRIDVLRSPNFTEENVAKHPLTKALFDAEGIPYSTEVLPKGFPRKALSDPAWVEERLRDWVGLAPDLVTSMEYGALCELVRERSNASQVFISRVRAQFPDVDGDSVIPLGWVEQAMTRWEDWQAAGRPEPGGRRVLGLDVAREGSDRSALAVRQGNVVGRVQTFQRQDTMALVAQVLPELRVPHAMIVIDTIGIGAGVHDRLLELGRQRSHPATVEGFVASGQSGRHDRTGRYKFRNDRSAAWWNMRELLDPSRGSNIALPRSEELLTQLTTPTWAITDASASIIVEPKDDFKKRLGRSPDEADAVIMAFWTSGNPVSPDEQGLDRLPSGEQVGPGAYRYSDRTLEQGPTMEGW